MRSALESVVVVLYVVCIYIGVPVTIATGWIRWSRRRESLTSSSAASLIGFILATCSALLALGSLFYAHAIGGFPFYDPTLMRIYRWGGLLSLGGIALGVIGCWRCNPLRWYAPGCALAMLFFWFSAAMGE